MAGKRNGTKTQLAVMKTEINYISETVKEIKENTKGLPVVMNDVSWLKSWHNRIVLGVIAGMILGGVAVIMGIG